MTTIKRTLFCLSFIMLALPIHAKIVFISHDVEAGDGWWDARDVYIMDDDGSNIRNLTPTPHQREAYPAWSPAWSPDGKKIVFIRHDAEGQENVYLMDADGSNPRALTENLTNTGYSDFFPDDNKTVTFIGTHNGDFGLVLLNIETGARRILCKGDINAPDWSPDRRQIVYREGGELLLMWDNGDNRRRFLVPPAPVEGAFYYRGAATWSPDGTRIVYEEKLYNRKPIVPRTSTIFIYDTRTREQKPLNFLPEKTWFLGPIWIDKNTLLISMELNGLKNFGRQFDLYWCHLPTQTLTQLTSLPGGEYSMDWHPDSLDVSPKEKETTTWGEIKTV